MGVYGIYVPIKAEHSAFPHLMCVDKYWISLLITLNDE